MALVDTTWYCNFGNGSSTGYYAVALRPNAGAVAAGAIRRQFTAPAVGSERCFVCIVAGTTAAAADATWVLTRGAKTVDGTVTWMECSGQAALNGDLANTSTWAQVKAASPAVLGQIIKRSNGASYQICTTAGAMSASEPAFSDTAGVTTTDTTAVWTSLGPVGNFTGGQAPHARFANACAANWFAAGSTIYVGHNHAETLSSSLNPAPATSAATIGKAICHNSAGSYPPAAGDITTGAVISTITATSMTFTIGGGFYLYGLTFRLGVGQSTGAALSLSTSNGWVYADRCSFETATTSATGSNMTIGAGSPGTVIFNNTTVKFGNVAQKIIPQNIQFIWQNTGQILVSGSAVPAILLTPATQFGPAVLEALDLSSLSGSLCQPSAIQTNLLIKDCKLHASATVDTPLASGTTIQLARCDSGATAYKSARYQYEGTESTEATITRVGGAVDPTGQVQSRKIVTSANVQWLRPLKTEPYVVWNPTTGANVTVTVCGTINAGAVPNNDDIWMEVEYLSDSGSPLGDIVNTTKASLLAASAAVAADSSSWNGGGSGAGWSPFKLTTTLSSPQPGLPGYLHARIRAAKLSTTFYIDPQVVLS